jgi:hypothetical protein
MPHSVPCSMAHYNSIDQDFGSIALHPRFYVVFFFVSSEGGPYSLSGIICQPCLLIRHYNMEVSKNGGWHLSFAPCILLPVKYTEVDIAVSHSSVSCECIVVRSTNGA